VARIVQSVLQLAMGWGSNTGGGRIFHACPDQPWGPPSHVHTGYQVFPRGQAVEAWCWPPTAPSSNEVTNGLGEYLHLSLCPRRHVMGWPLPLV